MTFSDLVLVLLSSVSAMFLGILLLEAIKEKSILGVFMALALVVFMLTMVVLP
jgi:hypothetical protein